MNPLLIQGGMLADGTRQDILLDAGRIAALLPPGTDCAELIAELVAAEDMANANFTRWPRGNMEPDDPNHPYQPGSECHEHWRLACERKESAVRALTSYGRAVAK